MLRLLGIFLSFITVVSITQNFGEEKIGLYFYANSVIAIVSCIFKFGTDKLIIKHNFKNSDIKGYFKDLILKVYSFTSIITLIIAALICEYQDNLSLVYLFIAIIAQALLYFGSAFYISEEKQKTATFYEVIYPSIVMIITIYSAIILNIDIDISAIFMIGFLVPTITIISRVKLDTRGANRVDSFELKEAIPIFTSNLTNMILRWFPVIFVEYYFNLKDVGLFSVCVRILILVNLIKLVINNLTIRKIAFCFKNEDFEKMKYWTNISCFYSSVICIPFLSLLLLFPDHILYLFGPEYIHAATTLRILSLGYILSAIFSSVGNLFIISGNGFYFTGIQVSSVLLTVMIFEFINEFTLSNAAISVSISMTTASLFLLVICRFKLGFFPMPKYGK